MFGTELQSVTLANCPQTPRILSLLSGGLSLDEIAAAVAMHRSSVYRRLRAVGCVRRWQPLSPAEKRRIRQLLESDLSRRVVARMTGRGLGTVARIGVEAYALPPSEVRFHVRRIATAVRCQTCGAKIVQVPCLYCALRAARET